MAHIYSLSIKNFRGIKEFKQDFGKQKLICLVGRGDSGKSTILEAISNVLSPSWNIPIHDTDFHNLEFENQIEIEATLTELPGKLISVEKYGEFVDVIDRESGEITSDLEKGDEVCLTIRFIVAKDLEPKWEVKNGRNEETKTISAYDRAGLNVFLIADYIDRHFSWMKGTPLYSLLRDEESVGTGDQKDVILKAIRDAKNEIDKYQFAEFNPVVQKILEQAKEMGIDAETAKTAIDFKDIAIKDGRVSLHDENTVPYRLKGKGSRRLFSIVIQSLLAKNGIVLIDEIEQGLEPDRAQHLSRTFKNSASGQIFLTTHSRDVVVELDCTDLFLVRKGEVRMTVFSGAIQGLLRSNPEVVFATKILICEGATEVGICRALNSHYSKSEKTNSSVLGVRFANGGGNTMIEYCKALKEIASEVALFCDSDEAEANARKSELVELGIKVFDWTTDYSLEMAIVMDWPQSEMKLLLNLAAELVHGENSEMSLDDVGTSMKQAIGNKYGDDWDNAYLLNCNQRTKKAIGLAAHKGKWFKSVTKGEALGNVVFKHFTELQGTHLRNQLEALSKWIGYA